MIDTSWGEWAACKNKQATFYPETRGTGMYDEARAICARCPVFTQCREWGDKVERRSHENPLYGFLAGESPSGREDRRVREKRARVA